MNATDLPDPLRDLPPSAKFVYNRLREADDDLTRAEIERATGLPGRTVRRALRRLRETGHVETHPSMRDVSKPCYSAPGHNGQRGQE